MSSTLRIGVVGAGARSAIARHAEAHDATIVAAVEPSPHAAARVAERLGEGVAVVATVDELVAHGVDAAFVTSPDDTHAAITIPLLRAGVPVFLEKPIATTIADADAVLQAAYDTGTKLYVGHNMRHMAVIRLLRDVVARGEIGEVKAIWCRHFVGHGGDYYFKDWHADRARSTGLLLQKGSHDIDAMHWIAGSVTRQVVGMGDLMVYGRIQDREDRSGQLMSDWFSEDNWPPLALRGLNPTVDVEDLSMVLMRLESGVLASYQQCHFTPDYWRNYTVIGTEGRAENFGDGDGGVVRVWNRRSGYRAQGDAEYPIVEGGEDHDQADKLTVAEFLRFVRTGEPTDTSPLSARESVATGVAATESLRDGSTPRRIAPVPEAVARYFLSHQAPAGTTR